VDPADAPPIIKPDFLGISSPRTGTHWLRANLNCHPRLWVGGETLWFYDLCLPYHQFTRYFIPGRLNGDISPMNCLVTAAEAARISPLLPDCKLLVLLRDPVSRAWSHIKHMERHREAIFADGDTDYFKAANCRYAVVHGDYLGALERWLSAFPRSSLFIGFYEDIRRRPFELLTDIFHHLGVEPVARESFGLERVYNDDPAGRPCPLVLQMYLQQIYRRRTKELVEKFHMAPPPEWELTLNATADYDLDYWTNDDRVIDAVKIQVLHKWLP
jgi:hypothetical protein